MPPIPRSRRAGAALALLLLCGAALPATAQWDLPRVGLSAAADAYVDSVTVPAGEIFTLYACAFGQAPGEPLSAVLDQPLSTVAWVVHQACCGAYLEVLATELNPAFAHAGDGPKSGMVTTLDGCADRDAVWLATLTVRLDAPGPGRYLWAAGPYAAAEDCAGGHPVFMDMPVTITVPGGDSTPGAAGSWGGLKSRYR